MHCRRTRHRPAFRSPWAPWNLRRLAMFGVALLLLGCSPALKQLDENKTSKLLPFLIDGVTTEEELEFRFGTGVAGFEDDRIVIYRYCETSSCDNLVQIVVSYDNSRTVVRHGAIQAD